MKEREILQIIGTDYRENTITLLREAGLASLISSKEALVGIKPNLVSATEASYGATTHPELIAGIIEYLQEAGFHNLLILEGAWVGDRTDICFDVCGYRELSKRYGVPLIDLQKDSGKKVDCSGMALSVCETACKVDFLINVPVLKGHCQTRITCALKNMKGLIPNEEKRRFHSMGLHKPIAHLNAFFHQDFILVDHICGDLDFEDGGNPVVRNTIMAGLDPVLIDSYVCRKLHYEADDVPYIRMAEELGVGSTDLDSAVVRTIRKGEEGGEEELPIPDKAVLVEDLVEEVESCSACYGYLIPALHRLREEGYLEHLPDRICIGQGYRGRKGRFGVGDCTGCFDHFVGGCPPLEDQIYAQIRKWIEDLPDSFE